VGTSKPSVVDTKVSQSVGSKASLADVGLMVPSNERGFQKSSRELLRVTAQGRDDGLREMLGLLVLRGGRHRGGHLTPHECQMKAVELR
jgi:hypothetical protein